MSTDTFKKQSNRDEKKYLRRGLWFSSILVAIAVYITGIMSIISAKGAEVGEIGIIDPIVHLFRTFGISIWHLINLLINPSGIVEFLKDKDNSILIYVLMIIYGFILLFPMWIINYHEEKEISNNDKI